MNLTFRRIPCLLLAAALTSGTVSAQQSGPDALSRVFKHRNGNTTETQKMGGSNEIRESMFDKNKILCSARTFTLDDQGRILHSVIYDGKRNPVASTSNDFDPQSGRMRWEDMKDRKGRLIRRLYYPGVTNLPANAKSIVAFSYDPEKQDPKKPDQPVGGTRINAPVVPVTPVTKDDDEFEVGTPQGTAAPTAQEAAAGSRNSQEQEPARVPSHRTWIRQKKK